MARQLQGDYLYVLDRTRLLLGIAIAQLNDLQTNITRSKVIAFPHAPTGHNTRRTKNTGTYNRYHLQVSSMNETLLTYQTYDQILCCE